MFRAMKKFAEEFATIIFNNEQERISERKTIFDKAKSGEDVKATEARKYQKEITLKRAEILKKMDDAVQEFLQKHLHEHGEYAFDISSVFNDEQDKKDLYATYICNSLNPIWRLSNINLSTKEVLEIKESMTQTRNEYDIHPKKEVGVEYGINLGVTGIENEGSSSKNRHWWDKEVKRPTVKGG